MKFVSVALLLVVSAVTLADNVPPYDLKDAPQLFEKFMKDYKRHYKDKKDLENHYESFKKNLEEINKDIAEDPNGSYGINGLADYSDEEFNKLLGWVPADKLIMPA